MNKNKRRELIGIHGLMGHGKDTCGAIMASALRKGERFSSIINNALIPLTIKNARFASAVKENIGNITGEPLHIVDAENYHNTVYDFTREQKGKFLSKWDMTLGRMLQIYATEGVRNTLHVNAWIYALEAELEKSQEASNVVHIITDLRFGDESKWIKNHGGTLIKVFRPEVAEKGRDAGHSSEMGLPDRLFDHVITNDKDLESLDKKVREITSRLSLFPGA